MKRICVLLCLAASTTLAQDAKVTPLLTKNLAGIPDKEGSMLTVEYAPGAASAIHRHNANTFVYVLEGSIVMQVRGGKKMILTPGQTFYEGPDDVPFAEPTPFQCVVCIGRYVAVTRSATRVPVRHAANLRCGVRPAGHLTRTN